MNVVRGSIVAVLVVGLCVVFGWGERAAAETISFTFDNTAGGDAGGDHAVNRTAGVVNVGNWNNFPAGGAGTVTNLIDNRGAATTVDVTWGGTAEATWGTGVVIDDTDADDSDRMMKGYLDYGGDGAGQNITIDITGIPYAADGYNLYLYHESSGGDGRLMSVSLDGGLTKVYAKDVAGIFQTDGQGFLEEHHATVEEADASDGGNYMLFTGLTAETLNIVTEGEGTGTIRSPVQGIQIDQPSSFGPIVKIDRQTGGMVLSTDRTEEILGYSITSRFGALDQSDWTTISGNFDAAGDGSIDPDDAWTVLTAPDSTADLSEAELAAGDGGTLASGTTFDLGNVWVATPKQDVQVELLLDTGAQLAVPVQYTGTPIADGDLNGDGTIDVDDWSAFLTGLNADLSGLSPAQAYQRGDLVNNDLATNHADFSQFKQLYEAANGAGSFAAMVASVPEPTSGCIMLIGMLAIGLRAAGRKISRRATGMLALLVASVIGVSVIGPGEPAAAGVISFNFDNTESEVGDHVVNRTAGVVNVGNWNNLPPGGAGTVTDLIDSAGVVTTADVTWGGTSELTWASQVVIDDTDADDSDRMMKGYLDYGGGGAGELITVDITEIPYADTGYDLYLYHESSGGDGRLMSVSLDGGLTQVYAKDVVGIFQTNGQGFIQEQHATLEEADASDGGNYLLFTGLTAETLNIVTEAAGTGTIRSPVQGIQMVQVFRPTLEVNRATGATTIKNDTSESLDMNFYEIRSASGALDPDGWDSLDAQNIDATDGDDPGSIAGDSPLEGWDEADFNTANVLTEAFLLGESTLSNGDRLPIGNAYSRQVAGEDLEFNYGLTDGSFRGGLIEYVGDPGHTLLGDVNLDEVVNGLDVDPFVDVLLNGPYQAEADMNEDSVVNGLDVDPFVAAVVGGGVQAVPEPSTLTLLALAGLAMVLRISKGGRLMERYSFLSVLAAGLLVAFIGTTARADSTNDRSYLFGDSTGVSAQNENATAGQKIGSGAGGVTFDSVSESNNPGNDNDAQNLSPSATAGPTYVSVGQGPFLRTADDGDPTPPAAGDLGAQFSGSGEYLRGARLGLPSSAAGSIGYGDVVGGAVWNPNDYTGISNRGYQLWVYPTSNAAAQSVVMDTNQHGVRISAAGNWSMHYPGGTDVESTIPVATDQWSHVMLVRPSGAAGGGRLYVDGIVVAVNGVGYTGDDNASLVLGSNTDQDADGNFTGGTEEFFSGLMDNLEMFVLGTSTGDNPEDFGTFDPQTDNQFIAGAMAGLPDGDVDMDGTLDPVADVDAFVAGWLNLNEVNGIQVGDLGSRAAGDLNFDGITDLSDAFVLHEALAAAGGGLDFSALTAAVPEPSTLVLLSLAAVIGLAWRRRSAQVS